jgi:hypothetical protein
LEESKVPPDRVTPHRPERLSPYLVPECNMYASIGLGLWITTIPSFFTAHSKHRSALNKRKVYLYVQNVL